jgi:protocatechuate 3,4-dioxygenase, beta subunit
MAGFPPSTKPIPVLSRRLLLAGASTWSAAGASERLTPTPTQPAGFSYPKPKPRDQDSDLVAIHGHVGRAQGELLHLFGAVRDAFGRPVFAARVEIWQANRYGRYRHKLDAYPRERDRDFQGFGAATTDRTGGYHFRTIRPGAYANRAPHIHLQVLAPKGGLVTQVYFSGERRNAQDPLLILTHHRELLIAVAEPPAKDGAARYRFDVVLGA